MLNNDKVEIVKEEPFRSGTRVNVDYDMVRVTLDMSLRKWRQLKKLLKDTNV
jgi:hypothetical protein